MKKARLIITAIFFYAVLLQAQNTPVVVNLANAKSAIKEYYKSGAYDREMEQVIEDALADLRTMEIPEKAAFVFDIDETSLSNWSYEINNDFGYIHDLWDKWVDSATAPAIPQTKRFYDSLIARGIKIIFITGRSQDQYDVTAKNLAKAGYMKYELLICKPKDFAKKTAIEYKSYFRKLLSDKFKIVGSIGDQWSDLNGGWTIMKVKLPNYMYFIP